MKKVMIFIVDFDKYCRDGLQMLLDAGFDARYNRFRRIYEHKELIEDAADVDAVIADTEPWDEAAFAACPKLKCLIRYGTGINSVDLDAAKRHNVIVANTPGYNANAVAEQAVSLLFSLVRDVPRLNALMRAGKWSRPIYRELSGKTIGILGFGAIGQKSAGKLSGLDATIVAYDKFPNEKAAAALGMTFRSFEEVLRDSDFLLIHLPLLPDTERIINAKSIAMMKDGVYVVNTGRGMLVDEAAVAQALRSGKIAAMASDVFVQEPPQTDNPLFACPNYICSPHISGNTYENMRESGIATAEAILAVFAGKEPKSRHA